MNIDAPGTAIQEMERQMHLHEDVLRYLTTRVDELEEGPSAVLRAKERGDDRGRRGSRDDGPRRPSRDDGPGPEKSAAEATAAKEDAPAEDNTEKDSQKDEGDAK
jgi:small subunit ribosomal protein S6